MLLFDIIGTVFLFLCVCEEQICSGQTGQSNRIKTVCKFLICFIKMKHINLITYLFIYSSKLIGLGMHISLHLWCY